LTAEQTLSSIGLVLYQVHSSAAGPKARALGYSNGNAVRIRDGRAAVSVRSGKESEVLLKLQREHLALFPEIREA
jgi:hypothetical protein